MTLDETAIPNLKVDLERAVAFSLAEDIGDGDISAQLISPEKIAKASVITREDCVLCGKAWVDEVFHQLDPDVQVSWHFADGDRVAANSILFELQGSARSILTGERTALNFLQTLSGTATVSAQFAALCTDSEVKILDTRKTLPGLRSAQKYAVLCGGCHNHRFGLYDAFLIKENHIAAAGGIHRAINQARTIKPGALVEVEVENLQELEQALDSGADIIMLDEFSNADTKTAMQRARGRAKLEISGSVDPARLQQLAHLKVDYISSGSLTKHLHAIDLSLRLHG